MALHRSAVRFGSSSHRAKQVTVSSRPGSVSGTVARGRAVPVPLQRVQGTEYGPAPSAAALKMASPPLATMRFRRDRRVYGVLRSTRRAHQRSLAHRLMPLMAGMPTQHRVAGSTA
jgi:hypothetical protein